RHQARHLGLGDLDLAAAEVGEGQVGDNIVVRVGGDSGGHVEILQQNAVVRVHLIMWPRDCKSNIKISLYAAQGHDPRTSTLATTSPVTRNPRLSYSPIAPLLLA